MPSTCEPCEPRLSGERIVRGDTWYTRWWAVLIDGEGVDLTDGWTVSAQMRVNDVVVVDFADDAGADILLSTVSVDAGADPPTTTTAIRLYLTPEVTGALTDFRPMNFDIDIAHPTFGPLFDPYRVTVKSGSAVLVKDVTR